jgi:ribosomal protein S18 acetylase RimI-like enzyme
VLAPPVARREAVHIGTLRPPEARRQARWIAGMQPWRSLGYEPGRLGAWLARCAREKSVRCVRAGRRTVAVIVVRRDVLLGDFVALLAVRPEAAGQGIGRALVEEAAALARPRHRWLYASSDSSNRAAGRFYRRLGFARVGRLPDLIRSGRTEILWRCDLAKDPANGSRRRSARRQGPRA